MSNISRDKNILELTGEVVHFNHAKIVLRACEARYALKQEDQDSVLSL